MYNVLKQVNGNQNVANAKSTAKNNLNNLTLINNAQKDALKSQIEGATTVAGVNQRCLHRHLN